MTTKGTIHSKPADWDSTASHYASIPIEGQLSVPCSRLLSNLNTLSPFSSASAILDVGCGPGTAVKMLINEYGVQIPSSCRIIASDFSKGMVEQVNLRKEKETDAHWKRLETAVYDAQDLHGVKDGEISHVMGSLVYFMIPDPLKGLKEAHRVLAPNGAFAMTSPAVAEWMELLQEAAQIVRPDPSRTGFELSETWKKTELIEAELKKAGFRDVRAEYLEVWIDAGPFVNVFIKSNIPGAKMVVGGFSEEEVDKVGVEWLKLVAKRYGDQEPKKVRGVVVVGSGRK